MRPGPTVSTEGAADALHRLMRMVLRSSPGPFTVVRTAARRHRVTSGPGSQFIASFTRSADADLFISAGPALRSLVVAASEVRGYHRDDGDARCTECGDGFPCRTRRMLDGAACHGDDSSSATGECSSGCAS